ncbi:LOW QUALITY PROTEIN: duodenase-1-like [Struthio camelus]|uniref:LOW QUALITY PROTEIN: duodenase-1-like n=1 Tax=Struthio camelus TaxID=8801 RepID=UPI00360400D8
MRQPQLLLALLLLLSCPWANTSALRSQIMGGHEAQPHSHPYMVFLKTDRFFCGGFLVAPSWVMTAAHCLGNTTVILGAHSINELEASQQIRGVLRHHPHPEYDPNTVSNDIMLLKLTAKATLNEYVKTIVLPRTSSDLRAGTKCSVAGWGLIDEDQATNKLFETKISIYSHRKCVHFYPALNNGMVCAGSFHELSDSSQGDSGGPLVCNNVAKGIVSFGYENPPGVYTRIANYLPWSRKTMKK